MSKDRFITGGLRGLGRAIAEEALENGDRVIATARRLGSLEGLRSRQGERLRRVALDVSNLAQAGAAIQAEDGRLRTPRRACERRQQGLRLPR